MWAVTGKRTSIVEALGKITKAEMVRIDADLADPGCTFQIPSGKLYFVLAAGILHGQRIEQLTAAQIIECFSVNTINVLRLCEQIFATVPDARVCVVGSASAWSGSYDQLYAASKAAVHAYVKTRRGLGRFQQLVAVAPPIIADSGMTRRRGDYQALMRSGRKMTTALHVAQKIRELLVDSEKRNEVVTL